MSKVKNYPEEFQKEVVAVATASDSSIPQLAKDFGIAPSTLRAWINKFGISELNDSADIENRELKKRNRQLEQENEVLRRATAYFSQAVLPK